MKNISILLIAGMLSVAACNKQPEQKSEAATPAAPAEIVNELPAMQITLVDNTKLSTRNLTGKNVIVMFQPDCDHCQREAKQMQENIEAFKAYQVYFISSAGAEELKKFAGEYKLNTYTNIHFGSAMVEEIVASLGHIDAPSLYIYDNGKLKQKFNGETDISEITKHL
jgi:peroxiredoxin